MRLLEEVLVNRRHMNGLVIKKMFIEPIRNQDSELKDK